MSEIVLFPFHDTEARDMDRISIPSARYEGAVEGKGFAQK